MMIRRLMILACLLVIAGPGLSACGKKAPLDPPPPRQQKEKPAS